MGITESPCSPTSTPTPLTVCAALRRFATLPTRGRVEPAAREPRPFHARILVNAIDAGVMMRERSA